MCSQNELQDTCNSTLMPCLFEGHVILKFCHLSPISNEDVTGQIQLRFVMVLQLTLTLLLNQC